MCLVLVMIPEVVYIFVTGDRSVLELHCRFWKIGIYIISPSSVTMALFFIRVLRLCLSFEISTLHNFP